MIASGGFASGTDVWAGASETALADGQTVGTVLSGGASIVSSGGVAFATQIGTCQQFASNMFVTIGGQQTVSAGGATTGTVVGSAGIETILVGGTAVSTLVQPGGDLILS